MQKSIRRTTTAALAWSLSCLFAAAQPLTIRHTPITRAVPGQPLTLKATVTGGEGGITDVTLHYALFRDAAPFRIAMNASGLDLYIGTIEAGLLRGAPSFSYFISAEDAQGNFEETAWHDVSLRTPPPTPAPAPAPVVRPAPTPTPPPIVQPTRPQAPAPAPVAPSAPAPAPRPESREGMSAATVGILAGGAAAVAIGAYLVSDSGGGGGGDSASDDGADPVDAAGTYNGSASVCLTPDGGTTSCEARPASILIDNNGRVFSDSLQPGQNLSANLSGNTFTMQASINDPGTGTTGSILYSGDVVGNRIVGTVSGTADINGVPGIYSGSFSLSR